MTTQHQQNATRWVSFLNNTGEDIPSYGVFALDDLLQNDEDSQTLLAAKYEPPSPVNDPAEAVDGLLGWQFSYKRVLAINGRSPVAAGKVGSCTLAYDGPAWARWNPGIDAAGEPLALSYGDQVGPHPGTFGVTALGFGFRVLQDPDTENSRVLVQQMKPETPVSVYVVSPWIGPVRERYDLANNPSPNNWVFGYVLNSGGVANQIDSGGSTSLAQGTLARKNCIVVRAFAGYQAVRAPCIPGMVIQAAWRDNYFHQCGGGAEFWRRCLVIEGAMAGEEAIVDVSTYIDGLPSGALSSESMRPNYYVRATAADLTFNVPTGIVCDLMYSRVDGKFYIVSVACS